MQQALLLAIGDAGGGIAKGGVAPVANLHEHPGLAVAHNQIELAAAHRHVGGDEDEPGAFQIAAGLYFIARPLGALAQEAGTI
ncbi:hypothetical protein GGER_46720 [Serratia rubidaea]